MTRVFAHTCADGDWTAIVTALANTRFDAKARVIPLSGISVPGLGLPPAIYVRRDMESPAKDYMSGRYTYV